jgi:hypothetical protein
MQTSSIVVSPFSSGTVDMNQALPLIRRGSLLISALGLIALLGCTPPDSYDGDTDAGTDASVTAAQPADDGSTSDAPAAAPADQSDRALPPMPGASTEPEVPAQDAPADDGQRDLPPLPQG